MLMKEAGWPAVGGGCLARIAMVPRKGIATRLIAMFTESHGMANKHVTTAIEAIETALKIR
jgi:hypothetical protein